MGSEGGTALKTSSNQTFTAWRLLIIGFLLALPTLLLLTPRAHADGVVSLTAMTSCPSLNGNGGSWCQGNRQPFNFSSFTAPNISVTGSSAFFPITNNTGVSQTTFTIDFIGNILSGLTSCGGGGTGIQGAGPGNGSTTCSISSINGGIAIMWNGLTWGAGRTFDLQVAGFSNRTTGVFQTPTVSIAEPGVLALLSTGLLGLAVFVRRKFAA